LWFSRLGAARFGPAAYLDIEAPDTAHTASLGCGNPLAVADLRPGEVVLPSIWAPEVA
jgi:hypothetical protein